jgi:hypothetical protein
VGKLVEREVGGERGLIAFFADETNSHIRGLDHADIVTSVAYTAYPFPMLGVTTDESRDIGLLSWGTAAGDNC